MFNANSSLDGESVDLSTNATVFGGTTVGCVMTSNGNGDEVTDATSALSEGGSELTEARAEVQLTVLISGASSSTYGTTVVTSGGPEPDAIIEVFFRNQMPYTTVEKRAEQVYGALHRNDDLLKKPVLIADSQDALETICQALGNSRGESVLEKLDLYEKLLEELSH